MPSIREVSNPHLSTFATASLFRQTNFPASRSEIPSKAHRTREDWRIFLSTFHHKMLPFFSHFSQRGNFFWKTFLLLGYSSKENKHFARRCFIDEILNAVIYDPIAVTRFHRFIGFLSLSRFPTINYHFWGNVCVWFILLPISVVWYLGCWWQKDGRCGGTIGDTGARLKQH